MAWIASQQNILPAPDLVRLSEEINMFAEDNDMGDEDDELEFLVNGFRSDSDDSSVRSLCGSNGAGESRSSSATPSSLTASTTATSGVGSDGTDGEAWEETVRVSWSGVPLGSSDGARTRSRSSGSTGGESSRTAATSPGGSPSKRGSRAERKQLWNQRAQELADLLRSELSICDRWYHLKRYKMCFVGKEAVDFLVERGIARSRIQAGELGQLLIDADLMHHVCDEHHFEDGYLFYRFRSDDPVEQRRSGPSVTFLENQHSYSGWLMKKGTFFINRRYFVLQMEGNATLYWFMSELDSSPRGKMDLAGATGLMSSDRFVRDGYAFLVRLQDGTTFMLSALSNEERRMWLTRLREVGCTVEVENPEEVLETYKGLLTPNKKR